MVLCADLKTITGRLNKIKEDLGKIALPTVKEDEEREKVFEDIDDLKKLIEKSERMICIGK